VIYRAFVLVPAPDDPGRLTQRAAEELRHSFADRGSVVTEPEGAVVLRVDGWSLSAGLARDPWVRDEINEIVDAAGSNRPDAAVLRTYTARFEVSSDPADPDMDHFNDYLIACQALERIDGAIAVELADGSFMSGKIIVAPGT
jgi:hypothetical protein